MTPADSTAASALPRASACPGLVRIVAARDGGLCRIRLPGGALDAAQARAIAAVAERDGSGAIEATNRANLQLRGVRAGREAAVTRALRDAGLGPRVADDADDACVAARDDVRNLLLSPTAGRDPHALLDSAALAGPLLAMLQSEQRLAALSPKFSLLLDGGERLAALDHPHDLWLSALLDARGERWLAVGLAGCPPRAGAPDARPALAAIRPEHACAFTHALLCAFVALAPPDVTRMRALLARESAEALLAHAAAHTPHTWRRDPELHAWRRPDPDLARRFGIHPEHTPDTCHVGAQAPLGRLDAAGLRALAGLAAQDGDGTLRITPWQGVLLPGVPRAAAGRVLARLHALGFACDPAQPLAHLVACAGSAGCARALADTKQDARQLAARLARARDVHLSGCARSCALPHPAAHTLLAASPGHYDLYRRDGTTGFGRVLARHLTIDQAALHLDGAGQLQDFTDA
ncbi:precorrin-3B synthase [Burkholderia sp. FERM BP-3421]|uniref:precorrin-3B synthase n=1 Tax=Burkholderia sp. FERM BP-3421 TaxID=1494466 RepID=UPI0023610C9C|nr:precorrin-3B synthase [Burkholderia sp. FERM BP-3421]WDD94182.1 precorrin-3B synthase [Burkholderia sp. FERM BP-3421]